MVWFVHELPWTPPCDKMRKRYNCNQADWSKGTYLGQMYYVVYDATVDVGVAEKLEPPVLCDREGNEVSKDSNNKYGRKCNIKLTKPNYILFGEKTGCNTNQTSDGNFSGEKFVCGRGQVRRKSLLATDHQFTFFSITVTN